LELEEEKILKEIRANHQHLILSYGGKLILTTRSLKFKPHAFNIGAQNLNFNLRDIDEVSATHVIGPRANQIHVKSKGERFRFVVWAWEKNEFVDAVKRQLAYSKSAP
jgi:hypothetical protein